MSTCLLLFVFTNSLFGLFTCSHVRYYFLFFLTNSLFRLFACLHAFYYLFLPTVCLDYLLVHVSFSIFFTNTLLGLLACWHVLDCNYCFTNTLFTFEFLYSTSVAVAYTIILFAVRFRSQLFFFKISVLGWSRRFDHSVRHWQLFLLNSLCIYSCNYISFMLV